MIRSTFAAVVAWFLMTMLAGSAGAQDVKYDKYQLPNGLTVILHENHRLPVVSVNLWYRVGAKDEPPGRSGFAHLFEHLMFMGTERVPGSDFDVIMETGGGQNNATTSFDRTNYYSEGPSELLPTLLWLEADRLEDLARAMNQEKLDRQRDIVRNEIRQNVENRPYGKSEEYLYRLMFPQGHPYHNSVYGTHEDLESATTANVKNFFANFYVPNNCSLVVAGDFKPVEIKPLIEKLFATLARGGDPGECVGPMYPEPRLGRVVRATMVDRVDLPRITFAYHSPGHYGNGDAEMDLLGSLLADGKSSRLYKRLVLDDKTAVEVGATQSSAVLCSVFQIEVTAAPGASLDAVERAVDEEVARLLASGPTAAELDQRKNTIEMGMLSRLEQVSAVADQLNQYQYTFGEPNSFKRDLDRYRNATAAGIAEWGRRVLTPESRAIVRVLPQEPDRESGARDERPAIAGAEAFAPLSPTSFTLKNGLPVMLWQSTELPLVSMSMVFRPGGPLVGAEKAGLGSLTAQMLEEGAGDLDALAFGDAVQALGAQFGAGSDIESAQAGITVLKRNFAKAAGLFTDAVRRPRMTPEDWERVQRLHIEDLKQSDERPTTVAARVALRSYFGDGHPYSVPVAGTVASVTPLAREDVVEAHRRIFTPASATLLIAGDITVDEARAVLDPLLGDWTGGGAASAAVATPARGAAGGGMRLVIVDRPEAVQTVVRFIMPAPSVQDERRVPLRVLRTLFGGTFTSRLNANLREKHGYSYGASCALSMQPGAGWLVASSSVRTDVTGPAIGEFMKEFSAIRSGDIPEAEATKARRSLRSDIIGSLSGLRGVLGSAGDLVAVGLPFETLAADLKANEGVNAALLNSLASKEGGNAFDLENGVLVLVGDKGKIMDQIKDMGLPAPVEVDANGALLKR